MSAPGQDPMAGQAPPPVDGPVTLPDGTLLENPVSVVNALIRAARVCAENAAGEQSAAEAKDYAAACKDFCDAVVVLDPTRLAGGETPEAKRAAAPPARTDGDRDGQRGE